MGVDLNLPARHRLDRSRGCEGTISYSYTSQLDCGGRGDLGGSQGHELSSVSVEGLGEIILGLVSKLVGLDFLLLGLHF